MLGIYADMINTATRRKDWDAPRHWTEPHERHPKARARYNQTRHQLRRWLRDTGVL